MDCANTTSVVQGSLASLAVCHMPIACPADPALLATNVWSGVTADYKGLQSIRAAITNSNSTAYDPWPWYAGPCHPSVTGPKPGIKCNAVAQRVTGLRLMDVVGCGGCAWSGYPLRPVPEFALLSELQVLDLANHNMEGEREVCCALCGRSRMHGSNCASCGNWINLMPCCVLHQAERRNRPQQP